jgi:hypothetical protein
MFGFGYRFGAFGGGLNGAPDNTVAPLATATTLIVGGVLSTTNGTWTGSGITFTYQWYRGASPIGGATANTYTLVEDDMYNNIYCQVTATNISGSAQANSNSLFAFEDLLDIYGANAYDWWDVTDDATLTKSGTRIDAIASKKSGSSRAMVSSGSARPQVVTNQVNGLQIARFDGISEFMNVATSTALYNFLHNATGGTVIIIQKTSNTIFSYILGTCNAGNTRGFRILKAAVINYVSERALTGQILNNSTGAIPLNQFNSSIGVFNPSAAVAADRHSAFLNSNAVVKNNVLTNVFTAGNSTFNLTLGKNPNLSTEYYLGDISEIFIAENQPTSGQLTRTQNYLTYKYGTFPII